MALLSLQVMVEVFPPLTHLGFLGLSAAWQGNAEKKNQTHAYKNMYHTLSSCEGFSLSWAACCEVETGESPVDTEEVVGNAS